MKFQILREAVRARSGKAILGGGDAASGQLAQCPPLPGAADSDAIQQTNIKQTSTALWYLLGRAATL